MNRLLSEKEKEGEEKAQTQAQAQEGQKKGAPRSNHRSTATSRGSRDAFECR